MEKEKVLFDNLPTGKPHISFSEVKLWKECSYRHHLIHIKKLDFSKPSPVLEFGTAIHSACEDYLLTRVMKPEICLKALDEAWERHVDVKEFTKKALDSSKEESQIILSELPAFLEKEFPGWEVVDAEHQLYESVEGHPHAFKGFIDGVIKCKGKKGEEIYWILDWKSSQRGWFREKRSDEMVKAQLGLYKNYWHQKNPQVPFKNIRCGFVLLKKVAKPGEHCELFPVSLGEVPIKRSLKVVSNMLTSVKRGVAIKNRDSCTYCEFKGTEHCT
jgi:hypothetical protein